MKRRNAKYNLFMLLLLVCTTVFANNSAAYSVRNVMPSSDDSPVLPSNGVFDVSQAGAATYSYAINSPQGVGGMNPNIAITYNSQRGNGIVGWGCNISGISAITRGIKTVFHDGVAIGINHDNYDAFYVDGVRLLRIPGAPPALRHLHFPEDKPYQQYKFGIYDINSSVTTNTKDGLACEYGGTPDARQLYTDNSGTNIINTWYINSVEDCNGNNITYKYITDNGTVYPKEIIYGTNTKQDTHIYNYIRFNYEQRPDVQEYLIKNQKVKMSLRLSSIEVGTNADKYRTYTFQYTTEDLSGKPFSRLHTITEQNAAGESRPPVTFQWDNLPAFSQKVLTPEIHLQRNSYDDINGIFYDKTTGNEIFLACDMTGDGLADIIEITPCTLRNSYHVFYNNEVHVYKAYSNYGTITYNLTGTFKLGLNGTIPRLDLGSNKLSSYQLDYYGDGLADICVPEYVAGKDIDSHLKINIIPGKNVKSGKTDFIFMYHILKGNDNSPLFTTADINNNGRSEIIVLEKEAYNDRYICEIIEHSGEREPIRYEWGMQLREAPKNIFTGDYNNDGMSDLLIIQENGYKIYFTSTGNFKDGRMFSEANCVTGSYTLGYADRMFQGNFNGDGLVDFLTNRTDWSNWYFYFNQGNGDFHKKDAGMPGLYKHSDGKDDDKMQCMVFDFDNDGKSDVVMTNYVSSSIPSKTVWMRSTGSSLVPVKESVSNNEQTSLASRFAVGCFTGSGQMELMNYGSDCYNSDNSESKVHIYTNESLTPSSGKVTAITDETGHSVDISYSSLTDTNVYSQGNACTYPVVNTTIPMHVVSAVKTDNGAVENAETTYKYTGMQTHVAGRGFLGFATVAAKNETTGDKVETRIINRDETIFVPTKTVTNKTSWGAFETTKVTNTYKIFPNKTFALEETISETVDHDNFYSTLYKVYDAQYGYLLSEKEEGDITSNYHETVYSDYEKYGSKWLPSTITYIDSNEDADDPVERETHITYNANGQKVSECINYDTSLPINHEYQYDTFGNLTSVSTSGNGVEKIEDLTEYDSSGRFVVKKQTSPASTILTYNHDMWGNLLSETDATNPAKPLTTTYTYNSWGQAESTTSPTGARAKTIRGWNNDTAKRYYVLELADGQPWTKTWFDSMGREVLKESVGLKDIELSTKTEYNKRGLPTQVTSQTGDISVTKTLQYDSRRRVTSETSSNAGTITYSYNGRDVTIDDNGRKSTKVYGDGGLVRSATDTSGEICYTYNAFGKPAEVSVISSANPVTMEYDDVGNRIALNDPDAGTTTYTHDALGRLRTRTDARGHKTSYSFDALGRKTEVSGNDAVFATFKYGESGNDAQKLIEERSGNLYTTYSYDEYGRLSSKTRHIDGEELSYSYTYNSLGQATRIVYPGGVTADYGYDCYGNNTSISVGNKVVWSVGTYTGKSLSAKLFRGTFGEDAYYDDSGRTMSNILVKYGDANKPISIYATSYSYDKATGNLKSRNIDRTGIRASQYETLDTLVSKRLDTGGISLMSTNDFIANLDQFKHEAIWLFRNEKFTYDDADRLIQVDRDNRPLQTIEYADNGNILSKTDIGTYNYDSHKEHAVSSIDATGTKYRPNDQEVSYNFFGKAETVSEWDDENPKEHNITYGPDMERWKSALCINDEEKRTIIYADDYEQITENGITRQFYYLGNNVILLRETDKADRICFATTDNLGSILRITDENDEKLFETVYDAWGKQEVLKNDIGFVRGYTGHEMLPEFGLINMNGRIYDPALGRFLSPDNYVQMPDNTQSFNRYAYCINNPLKYTDPDGQWFGIDDLFACVIGGTINLAVNLFEGNVKNIWHGATLFAAGAAAGECALYGQVGVSAIAIGAGNSIINQGFTNGWNNIDWGQVGISGTMSLMTSVIGGQIGGYLAKPLGTLTSNISNTVLRNIAYYSLCNSSAGFILGTGFSLINGNEGGIGAALKSGLESAGIGLVTGAINGFGSGIQEQRLQKTLSIRYDIQPEEIVRQTLASPETPTGTGTNSVYLGRDENGDVRYVGITNRDPQLRFNEHLNSGTGKATLHYDVLEGTGTLSRIQARIIEQRLINAYGIGKHGSPLYNKINSIRPSD